MSVPTLVAGSGSGLLEQLGVELVHHLEVSDFRLEVAVVFLLGNRDAVERFVVAEGDLSDDVLATPLRSRCVSLSKYILWL